MFRSIIEVLRLSEPFLFSCVSCPIISKLTINSRKVPKPPLPYRAKPLGLPLLRGTLFRSLEITVTALTANQMKDRQEKYRKDSQLVGSKARQPVTDVPNQQSQKSKSQTSSRHPRLHSNAGSIAHSKFVWNRL